MIWILVLLYLATSGVSALVCTSADLQTDFTQCVDSKRRAIYSWKSSTCTNQPPMPAENISCIFPCPAGSFLSVDPVKNEPVCEKCPSNTYSTGSTFRVSSADMNWDAKIPFSQTSCFWIDDRGYWKTEKCASFQPTQDATAIKVNVALGKPGTWNILEFKMVANLVDDGYVSFTYKKSSKIEDGVRNGRFRFDVGFYNQLHDDDPGAKGQTSRFPLKKGANDLMWYYAFSTSSPTTDLYAEISKIEISPVAFSSTKCEPCKLGVSLPGSAQCSGCEANFFTLPENGQCAPCPSGQFSYPGAKGCSVRPKCVPKYDAEPIFTACANGQRSVSYKWRADSPCDKDNGVLPAPKTGGCEICPPGSYISADKCVNCAVGYFNKDVNARFCTRCPSGKFAGVAERFENLESFPDSMTTSCEVKTEGVNLCAFYKGWVVANNVLTSLPSQPLGIKIVLKKIVNITLDSGSIQFAYMSPSYSAEKAPIEQFTFSLDGYTITLPLSSTETSRTVSLSKGVHIAEWAYERLVQDIYVDPLAITSIRIEGGKGSSDSCTLCSRGFYSSMGEAKCSQCGPGTMPNENSTSCVRCAEGKYKSSILPECEECPAHTHPSLLKSSCDLFDAYEINGTYMLNAVKFDSTRKSGVNELKDMKKSESFFGPFSFTSDSQLFFMSLMKSLPFDVEKYEYQEEDNSLREGHIFALFTSTKSDTSSLISSKEPMRKTHFRVKKNLGSVLTKLDLSELGSRKITLQYGNGDICDGVRYQSSITLVCDKKADSLTNIEFLEKNSTKCSYAFVWRTPYACSQCKLSEAAKYYGPCRGRKRIVYVEESENCIVHGAETGGLYAESIGVNATNGLDFSTQELVDISSRQNRSFNDYVYSDEYFENCNEMELSYILIIILAGAFVVLVIIALVTIVVTIRDKKKYQRLVEERTGPKEMKHEVFKMEGKIEGIKDVVKSDSIGVEIKESTPEAKTSEPEKKA